MRWKNRPAGSNWGDFGPDDQIGRMNLITPERRLAGVREVKEGRAFVLSLPLDHGGHSNAMRKPPRLSALDLDGHPTFNHVVEAGGRHACDVMCDDAVMLHLQYSTQWDSLAHWGQKFDADGDGVAEMVYYNGYRAHEHLVGPKDGAGPCAKKLGIESLAECGVQGRGVMVNLKAMYGAGRSWVGYDEMMRAIDAQKVDVQAGDFLLLNTGYGEAILDMGTTIDMHRLEAAGAVIRGSDEKLLRWIDDSGIVAICSDNLAVEGFDFNAMPPEGQSLLPLHELCLFKLGIFLGELWQTHELADWLEAHQRSAFLLTAPPLRLPGAVGSPATPIATV